MQRQADDTQACGQFTLSSKDSANFETSMICRPEKKQHEDKPRLDKH